MTTAEMYQKFPVPRRSADRMLQETADASGFSIRVA